MRIINPLDYPDWDKMLLYSNNACFFHSSEWARAISETYAFKPVYLAVMRNDRFRALIPIMEVNSIWTGKRGVSLPFTDYCGAFIDDSVRSSDLLEFLAHYGERQGWKTLEIRGSLPNLQPMPAWKRHYRHTLELSPDLGLIFSNFRKSTKRSIKQALGRGVTVHVCNSMDSLKEFHRLNCLTRKRHGVPPQPFRFFKALHRHVLSRNLGNIFLATYGNRPVAGAIYFHFGSRAIWKYAASDMGYKGLGANHLLTWEAVQWYSNKAYQSICFGRTEINDEGLCHFKTGFGALQDKLTYYRYSVKANQFLQNSQNSDPCVRAVFRSMPIPMLRAIGSICYRHVG